MSSLSPISATDPRLANFATKFGGTANSDFSDFVKILNASPQYVQQLNDYLSAQGKGEARVQATSRKADFPVTI